MRFKTKFTTWQLIQWKDVQSSLERKIGQKVRKERYVKDTKLTEDKGGSKIKKD